MRFLRFILIAVCAACAALAQTNPDVGGSTVPNRTLSPPAYPAYFLSFGAGYTRNAVPRIAEGFVSAAIGLGGGNYSITTIDMTAQTSAIRTGFGKVLSQSGNFILLARVDAGISTVNPVIGSFSGGGIIMYDMKGIAKALAGTYAFGEVRIMGATQSTTAIPNQVTPGFYFGFGKSF